MPRISREDQLERDLTARLQAMLDDPLTPGYVRQRCLATLATLLRRRDKRKADKAAAAAARRAQRDLESRVYPSTLPDNGRLVRG
jgi:hypothetical protein